MQTMSSYRLSPAAEEVAPKSFSGDVWAIAFPVRGAQVERQVERALTAAFALAADALQVAEGFRVGLHNLLAIEFERSHALQQEVGGFRTLSGQPAHFRDRHADVCGKPLDFAIEAADWIRQIGSRMGPRLPPARNDLEWCPALRRVGLGGHLTLL